MSTQTFTKELFPVNFNFDRPVFKPQGEQGYKYANFTLPIQMIGDTTYGYVTVEFSEYTSYNDVIVEFALMAETASRVSYSDDLNSIFFMNTDGVSLTTTPLVNNGNHNYPHKYYIIVNADTTPTRTLNILVSVGTKNPTIGDFFQETIEVTCIEPLYRYVSGLHVYSPWDAIEENAIYKAEIASWKDYTEWGFNTRVYQNSFFSSPAMPYYYGIGDKVIKVGSDFDRAYGTKERYKVVKKRLRKPRTYKEILGPQWWVERPDSEPYSYSCVKPIFARVGLVEWVVTKELFYQPQQYRYYMGYDASNPEAASKETFTIWDWNTQTKYPITGSQHAIQMLNGQMYGGYVYHGHSLLGIPVNFNTDDINQGLSWLVLAALGAAAVTTTVLFVSLALATAGTGAVAANFATALFSLAGTTLCPNLSIGPPGWILLAVLALLGLIALFFALLQRWTKYFEAECGYFNHYFTDKPYIKNFVNLGSQTPILFRDIRNMNNQNGWITDGIYAFQQNEYVRRYETSRVNAVTNLDPLVYDLQYSVRPDLSTLIKGWNNLLILIYISGKPEPYCGGGQIFYNRGITITLEKELLQYCDMEKQIPVDITIPANIFHSCISQQAVDDVERNLVESMIEQIVLTRTQVSYEDSYYGWLDIADFTHELKVETTPNRVSLMYKASEGLIEGTTLYYDYFGCNKVLDGFYSYSSDTMYKTFLQTKDGSIIRRFYMREPNSTTTTTGERISTDYVDYTSNWYLYDVNNEDNLSQIKFEIERIKNFNPNSLYRPQSIPSTFNPPITYTTNLKKGFLKTPGDVTDMKVYNDFTNLNIRTADYGFYLPLIDFIDNDTFKFSQFPEIYLSPEENCLSSTYGSPTFDIKLYKISFNNYVPVGCPQELSLKIDIYGSRANSIGQTAIIRQGDTQVRLAAPGVGHLVRIVISVLTTNLVTNYIPKELISCNGVAICNQSKLWMKKNLDVTTYRNGDEIPLITNVQNFNSIRTGARTYPNGDPSLVSTYGYLYNWYALNDPRGVGPQGFRLPTMQEVQSSFNSGCYQTPSQGPAYYYKQSGTTNWLSPNDANNMSNFTALPAGKGVLSTGTYQGINKTGIWWTLDSDTTSDIYAKIFKMEYNSYLINTTQLEDKRAPLSARLIAN